MFCKIDKLKPFLFWKFLFLLIGVFVLFFGITEKNVFAEQEDLQKREELKTYEIEFVIDVSGSMLQSEVGKTTLELLDGAIELLEDTNTKVGIIGYNHTIAYQYPLTSLNKKEEKESLIHYIKSIQFQGDTDIGLGLKTAVQEFSDIEGNVEKILILLSDGETDLPFSQDNRTIEDSREDEQEAIALAKEKGIVVYTIGLATRFDGNVDNLNLFSKETQGVSYAVSSSGQLYGAISSILQKHYFYQSYSVKREEIDGKTKIVLPIPDQYLSRVSVWIFPAVSPEKIQILTTTDQVTISQKSCGTRIIWEEPPKETITIKLDKAIDNNYSVIAEGIYNLTEVFLTPLQAEKKKNVELLCSFIDNKSGEVIVDLEFYKSFSAAAIGMDKEKQERKTYLTEAAENGFYTTISAEQSEIYQVFIQYNGDFLNGKTEEKEILFINTQPKQVQQIKETILGKFRENTIELKGMFEDPDGDFLTYSLYQLEEGLLGSLEETRLTIQAEQYGEFSVWVQAVDEEGASSIGEIQIHSVSFWNYYHTVIIRFLAAGIFLFSILISYLIWKHYRKEISPPSKQKKAEEHLEGVLVGYFLKVENEEEIPPLRWNLKEFHRKIITLKELLEEKEIEQKAAESSKIRIKAEEKRVIAIWHDINGIVLHGSKEVSRKQEERIYIGEKIYIGFSDQKTELELRYKSQ